MIAQRDGKKLPAKYSLPIDYIEYSYCKGRFSEYKAIHGIPPEIGVSSRIVLLWGEYRRIENDINKPKKPPNNPK